MKYTINDLAYGGRYHNEAWNPQFNKEANIQNALANCTTAVIAFCLIEKNPLPVSTIANASNWHNLLINGWRCIDFDKSKVKVGDIIQWVEITMMEVGLAQRQPGMLEIFACHN